MVASKETCPVLRPTRAQFEKPFCDFVQAQFRKHPEWPCFKVVSKLDGIHDRASKTVPESIAPRILQCR